MEHWIFYDDDNEPSRWNMCSFIFYWYVFRDFFISIIRLCGRQIIKSLKIKWYFSNDHDNQLCLKRRNTNVRITLHTKKVSGLCNGKFSCLSAHQIQTQREKSIAVSPCPPDTVLTTSAGCFWRKPQVIEIRARWEANKKKSRPE